MSHFSVAVVSKSPEDVEHLLAPYQENNMDDCPKEYLEFHSLSEEYESEYEAGSCEKVKLPDGTFISTWDDRCYREITKQEYEDLKKEGAHTASSGFGSTEKFKVRDLSLVNGDLCDVTFKQLYPTLKDYLEDWHDAEFDEEQQDWGYWENPNAKWDYWTVGGRWGGLIKLKSGQKANSCKIKDVDLSPNKEAYNHAIRYWEINIEGKELLPDEDKNKYFCFYKPAYFTERYGTKEAYAEHEAAFMTYAMVTPDGQWHGQGDMGWFACDNATGESITEFHTLFAKAIAEADPEYYLTVVDCHI